MNMFMIRPKANRAFAISAGLVLAAGLGAVYAPLVVEIFSWDRSPGVRQSQVLEALLWCLPLALIAGGVGAWIGFQTAASRCPRPAWRAAWIAVGLWLVVGLVLLPGMLAFAVGGTPLCAGAAGLSGLASAFIRRKGSHGTT